MQTHAEIFEMLLQGINQSELSETDKNKLLKNIHQLQSSQVNLLITGATGVGKSSTINALYDQNIAKVGVSPNPETMCITRYELGNLIIWDSPGLGDGAEADAAHTEAIVAKLHENDEHGNALIDLVLVLLDGSSRDLGTSFDLINKVVIPNLGEDKSRIIVAINQADQAMKGRGWNVAENRPDDTLRNFLEEKVVSVKKRIFDGVGITIEPIYFSAGYTDGVQKQSPYNLSKLLYYIVLHTPEHKRLAYVSNINTEEGNWEHDDGLEDYLNETKKSWAETVTDCAEKGAELGSNFGLAFGIKGMEIGDAIGRVLGGAWGVVRGIF
jgi:predicted GTPase